MLCNLQPNLLATTMAAIALLLLLLPSTDALSVSRRKWIQNGIIAGSDELSATLSQTRDSLFVSNEGVKQTQIGANISNEGNRDVTRKVILADALFRFKCVNCRCIAVLVSINIDTTDCVDRGCGCGLEKCVRDERHEQDLGDLHDHNE
jgi:hypothetical protein